MLVRDGCLVGIVDWEFSGVYPLSELFGVIQLIHVSQSGRSEGTEEEEDEWDGRYRQGLEKIVRQRRWTEEIPKTLLGGGWPGFQKARTAMFRDSDGTDGDN